MADEEIFLDGKVLGDLRVVDLKKELDKRGLSKSGSKSQLVERLKSHLVNDEDKDGATDDNNSTSVPEVNAEENEVLKQYFEQKRQLLESQKDARKKIEEEEERQRQLDESSVSEQENTEDKPEASNEKLPEQGGDGDHSGKPSDQLPDTETPSEAGMRPKKSSRRSDPPETNKTDSIEKEMTVAEKTEERRSSRRRWSRGKGDKSRDEPEETLEALPQAKEQTINEKREDGKNDKNKDQEIVLESTDKVDIQQGKTEKKPVANEESREEGKVTRASRRNKKESPKGSDRKQRKGDSKRRASESDDTERSRSSSSSSSSSGSRSSSSNSSSSRSPTPKKSKNSRKARRSKSPKGNGVSERMKQKQDPSESDESSMETEPVPSKTKMPEKETSVEPPKSRSGSNSRGQNEDGEKDQKITETATPKPVQKAVIKTVSSSLKKKRQSRSSSSSSSGSRSRSRSPSTSRSASPPAQRSASPTTKKKEKLAVQKPEKKADKTDNEPRDERIEEKMDQDQEKGIEDKESMKKNEELKNNAVAMETDEKKVEDSSVAQNEESGDSHVQAKLPRRISRQSDKEGGSTEEKQGETGDKPARKRRWGSKTAKSSKKTTTINISTDSLKGLIPEIKSSALLSDPVLDLGNMDSPSMSENEDDKRDVKIKRTVVQRVAGQSDEEETVPEDKPTIVTEVKQDKPESPPPEPKISRQISRTRPSVALEPEEPEKARRSPSPAKNPATNIVHISNLVRPFTLLQLTELLKRTGTLVDGGFWIDKIKSHCYATFETEDQAFETRKALHGTRWPSSNPKILRVDFADEEEFQRHKSADDPPPEPKKEQKREPPARKRRESEKSPRDSKKKEDQRKQHVREWDRDKIQQRSRSRSPQGSRSKSRERRRQERLKERKERKEKKVEEEAPAKLLDDLFKKTKATPCIYWLPLTEEQIEKRDQDRKERQVEREKRKMELDAREAAEKKLMQHKSAEASKSGLPARSRSPQRNRDQKRTGDRDRSGERPRRPADSGRPNRDRRSPPPRARSRSRSRGPRRR